MEKNCIICNKVFKVKPSHYDNRFNCSRECFKQYRRKILVGPRASNWKGGVQMHTKGWKWIYCPEHPNAHKNMIAEHRLIMEKKIGRYLTSEEVVHHKDRNKLNNNIENLELTNKSEHAKIHMKEPDRIRKSRETIYKVLKKRWGYEREVVDQ